MLEQERVRRSGEDSDEYEGKEVEQRESPTTPIPGSCFFTDFLDDGDEEDEDEEGEAQEGQEGNRRIAVGGMATLAGPGNRSAGTTFAGIEGAPVVRTPTPATLRKCQSTHVCMFVEMSIHGSGARFLTGTPET
jgi:hypothetical protein